MTLSETKSEISSIISATGEYVSSISALKSELSSITGSVNGIGSSINENIESNAIINYSTNVGHKISTSIDGCKSLIDSAISTVRDDANKKIMELVSSYNSQNSRLEKDKREEYLSYGDFCI